MSRPAPVSVPSRFPVRAPLRAAVLAAAGLLAAPHVPAAFAGGGAAARPVPAGPIAPEPARALGARLEAAWPIPFRSVLLIEEDGTRRIVEEEGDVYRIDARDRRLIRSLTPEQIAALRHLLGQTGADRWSRGDATFARGRSRIVLVRPGGATFSAALPSLDEGVARFAEVLRALTR